MNFKEGSPDVQREWRDLVKVANRDVEAALRQAVKRSLLELSRAINGDAKTEPQTLFGVQIALDAGHINYRPSMINLTHVVNVVAKELISIVAVVPRLRADLTAAGQPLTDAGVAGPQGNNNNETIDRNPTLYSVISNDEEILKIVVQIMNGMSSTATELQKFLGYWEKYKPIWEMDKDAYIRRYAKANRNLKHYDDDVTKHRNQQMDIQKESISHAINFVQIDCTLLKAALVAHCQTWQQKLLTLLNANARQNLDALHRHFEDMTAKLTATTHQSLPEKTQLLTDLQTEAASLEANIPPIEDMYATLQKFDLQVAAPEQARVTNLREASKDLQKAIEEAQQLIDDKTSSSRVDNNII